MTDQYRRGYAGGLRSAAFRLRLVAGETTTIIEPSDRVPVWSAVSLRELADALDTEAERATPKAQA